MYDTPQLSNPVNDYDCLSPSMADGDTCSAEAKAAMVKGALIEQARAYLKGETPQATAAVERALENICTEGVKCKLRENRGKIIAGTVAAVIGIGYLGHLVIPRIKKGIT